MTPYRLYDLPLQDRLAVARHLLDRQRPATPGPHLDQVAAALAEATDTFQAAAAVLPLIDPERDWRPATPALFGDAHVLLLAATLGCGPCCHLLRGGPQPSVAKLALRRHDCRRCSGTVRRPPPGEADRCDVCGTMGVVKFTPITVQLGTVLVVGDCCHDCRVTLGFECEEAG
jgi:hypothetical protein